METGAKDRIKDPLITIAPTIDRAIVVDGIRFGLHITTADHKDIIITVGFTGPTVHIIVHRQYIIITILPDRAVMAPIPRSTLPVTRSNSV
jgi:hypothetical protein